MRERRAVQDSGTQERAESSQASLAVSCSECGGPIVHDPDEADLVCAECGLIAAEQEIDAGPEWRAYTADEREEKSRTGAPTTQRMHDNGLSTTIGWKNKDGYGQTITGEKRQQLARLRTWDERFRTRDSRDRNLKQALGEIDRMSSALGIPEQPREVASVLYRQALDNELLPGRSIEGMATASLYAASRLEGIPRPIDEVAAVSRVDDLKIKRAYRYLARELELEIPPTSPLEYLTRLASEISCTTETERRAKELLENAIAHGVHSGKDPVGVAASALYAAGRLTNDHVTQSAVSEAANVSEVTIRSRYREILDAGTEGERS
ncbi:transcription initiation factor IIB 2 [Halobacteria archaeon AArc-curdl1]|uniref:Transcription initiation factor IIB n=1 Tax=Natronosalvus hydrolyticus TaxID=2979988 RepID=A0AAP3E7N2_9EURY|nr:transcription initiation factor IIB 2 [Halobacteria archaeon AArc-curdl1]